MEEAYEEDSQEQQEEMCWVDDKDEYIHLTRDEYSRFVNKIEYFEEDKNPFGVTHSQYQKISDNLMAEL